MWFQLNTTFSTHLGALSTLQSNYGVTYSLSNFTKTTAPDMVEKNKPLTVVLKMVEGATFTSATMTDGTTSVTGTLASSDSTVTMTIAQVKGPVTVIARAASASVTPPEEEEPETPVTPTNYTFTINPDPTSATVTLTATGYTQNGNSITVANGTSVSWKVSADGYIEQNGTWTANGQDETLPVTLDKENGGSEGDDTGDLTAYIQEGKAIMKAGELSDNASFFSVVNYPVKGATYYLIPYARNAFCLTSTGGASGGIVAGGGNPEATIRAAGTAATMSVCFKYEDISPSEVTITETVAPA